MLSVEKFTVRRFDYLYFKDVQDDLIWTNFRGDPDKNFGKRGFSINVTKYPDIITFLEAEGVNIKCWDDHGTKDPTYSIPVNVDLDNDKFPCEIYSLRDDGMLIPMSRGEIVDLDTQEFTYVDMKLREYHYTKGNGGVSLYLAKAAFAASVDPYEKAHTYNHMNNDDEEVPFAE